MSTNMSKYPEIIVDKDKNAVNTNLKVDLTVEQLYDLFHHTHNLNDLVGMGDGELSETDKVAIKQLDTKINDVQKAVAEQSANIAAIKDSVQAIQSNIDSILEYIEQDIQSVDIQ